jgi:hypothetical protein
LLDLLGGINREITRLGRADGWILFESSEERYAGNEDDSFLGLYQLANPLMVILAVESRESVLTHRSQPPINVTQLKG